MASEILDALDDYKLKHGHYPKVIVASTEARRAMLGYLIDDNPPALHRGGFLFNGSVVNHDPLIVGIVMHDNE